MRKRVNENSQRVKSGGIYKSQKGEIIVLNSEIDLNVLLNLWDYHYDNLDYNLYRDYR